LQSGSDEILVAMRRGYTAERYLEKLAAARAAIEDLAVTTDIIVGFPGETEAHFEETLAVVAEAQFDSAYTFIFSPRPGTRAAAMTDQMVPAEVISERFARLCDVVDRAGLLKHEARVGVVEEVLVEGPSRRDENVLSGRTRQGKLVHFSPGEHVLRAGALATVEITHGAPHHLMGDLREVLRGPRHRTKIPVFSSSRPGRPVALVGVTASGKSSLAHEVAVELGYVDILSVDSMTVYRGMDIATAKASAAERTDVPYHLLDLADPSEEFSVVDFQRAAREALAALAPGRRALLVGGTGLYGRAVLDDFDVPPQFPEVMAALRTEAAERGLATLYGELERTDPLAASRMEPTNVRRLLRALEVVRGSGRPFSDFGPGLSHYPDTGVVQIGLAVDFSLLDQRIEERFRQWLSDGLLDELRRLLASPRGLSKTARQAVGYKELFEHLEEGADLEECLARAVLATRRLARRQRSWFARDPRITWYENRDEARVALVAALQTRGTERGAWETGLQ
jgi:tRNA dimethylallyltransferase